MNTPIPQSPTYPVPNDTGRSSLATRLTILGLSLLVLVPVGYYGLRGEVDRWRAAQAMESWLDGDKQDSLQRLTEISQRLPHDHRLKLVLSEWLLEDYQAEQALQLVREIPPQYRDRRSQTLLQHCLLALGQPAEALEAYRQDNPANEVRVEQELFHKNTLAYFQALANVELPLATRNSNLVVNEVAKLWNRTQHIPLSAHMQGLFCSAVIYRHQWQRSSGSDVASRDKYADKAIAILSGAVAHLETEYERLCQRDDHALRESLALWFGPLQEAGEASEQPVAPSRKEDTAHALATLLTLRALIYQDLQQDEASFTDRRRVLKLGYEPEEIAEMIPPFSDCVFQLELVSTVLDTRGCVFYQSNEFAAALADLNLAVMGQAALVDVADIRPRTQQESSLDPRQQREVYVRGPQRTLATLLFHRSWVNRALGYPLRAAQDLAEIRKLGFVPGNYLF